MVKTQGSKIKKTKKNLQNELVEKEEKVEEVEEIEKNNVEDEGEEKNYNKNSRLSKLEKNIEAITINSGVIYIGHLPWGFDDKGIKKYFQQFGKITRIMVPKSKKTGRVKGYAFIEFEDREVAEIAAKTMNNYILFDKILKCSFVEDTTKYELIFKRWKRKFKFFDKYQNYVQEKNKIKPKEEIKQNIQMMLEKEEAKRKKLAELGLDYEFPGYKALIEQHKKNSKPKETVKQKHIESSKKTKK